MSLTHLPRDNLWQKAMSRCFEAVVLKTAMITCSSRRRTRRSIPLPLQLCNNPLNRPVQPVQARMPVLTSPLELAWLLIRLVILWEPLAGLKIPLAGRLLTV